MRIGWLTDQTPNSGGAELTQAEFRAAAPGGVEVIDCPPIAVEPGVDRYVVHNCTTYGPEIIEALEGKPVFRYWHDCDPNSDPVLREWLLANATHIFCSPLQRERFPHSLDGEWPSVPPAVDLARFRPTRQMKRNTERVGTCWLGSMMNQGKGIQLAGEYAEREGIQVDFFGNGPHSPGLTTHTRPCGSIPYEQVPTVLASYERFLFLPSEIEPFGRAVVEAWAAGCELVINANVGARYWIEEAPEKIETAAKDFWSIVCG